MDEKFPTRHVSGLTNPSDRPKCRTPGFSGQAAARSGGVRSTTTWWIGWGKSRRATVLEGDVAEAVAKLKAEPGRNILKFGTGELDKTLLEHRLLDELYLSMAPVVIGRGEHLFVGAQATFELLEATPFASGIVVLKYAPGPRR